MGAEDNRSCFGEAGLLEVKTDDKPICKGLVFRAHISSFISNEKG